MVVAIVRSFLWFHFHQSCHQHCHLRRCCCCCCFFRVVVLFVVAVVFGFVFTKSGLAIYLGFMYSGSVVFHSSANPNDRLCHQERFPFAGLMTQTAPLDRDEADHKMRSEQPLNNPTAKQQQLSTTPTTTLITIVMTETISHHTIPYSICVRVYAWAYSMTIVSHNFLSNNTKGNTPINEQTTINNHEQQQQQQRKEQKHEQSTIGVIDRSFSIRCDCRTRQVLYITSRQH